MHYYNKFKKCFSLNHNFSLVAYFNLPGKKLMVIFKSSKIRKFYYNFKIQKETMALLCTSLSASIVDHELGSVELENCKYTAIFLKLIALLKILSNITDYNELHFFIANNFVILE